LIANCARNLLINNTHLLSHINKNRTTTKRTHTRSEKSSRKNKHRQSCRKLQRKREAKKSWENNRDRAAENCNESGESFFFVSAKAAFKNCIYELTFVSV